MVEKNVISRSRWKLITTYYVNFIMKLLWKYYVNSIIFFLKKNSTNLKSLEI